MGGYVHVQAQHSFNQFNEIDTDQTLSEKLIKEILKNNVKHIQINKFKELSDKTFQKLNERIFKIKPEISLRLYGYGHGKLDLRILKYLTNIETLGIDGVYAENESYFSELKKLKHLSYDTKNTTNYDFLNLLPDNLISLRLEPDETKNFKVEIDQIKRFKNLNSLFILGHYKDLDKIIPSLQKLEKLILSKIKSINNIDFVKSLLALRKLHLKSISLKNADVLGSLDKLQFLELYKIDCIDNLNFLSRLPSLQHIFLQSMNKIKEFPQLPTKSKLRKIELWYMKNIRDFSNLQKLSSLQEFCCREMTLNDPEDFIPVLLNNNIKEIDIWFLTEGKRKKMEALFGKYKKTKGDVSFMYDDADFG